MGYRSDVAICIYGPKDKMTALVAAARIQGVMPVNAFGGLHMFDYDDNKHMIHAYYEDVKWYDGYKDVDTWHEFLGQAAEFDDLSTEFLRIGEDVADIEANRHGECQFFLGANRSVRVELPEEASVNT
jgi:hypothetical protein